MFSFCLSGTGCIECHYTIDNSNNLYTYVYYQPDRTQAHRLNLEFL